ncbi:hypothetical protein AHAS_Ahas18G0145000 [Arachis hypogaea]
MAISFIKNGCLSSHPCSALLEDIALLLGGSRRLSGFTRYEWRTLWRMVLPERVNSCFMVSIFLIVSS